ncbi:endodeoxyribonuclease [Sporothrix epigloea]|uniref:DNA topoisomerase (ATP-hydrolyzing) n=1 Tax=Sporothrix epigloea TaxID=1892477 RepID=A0ABP0DGL9_9PEZI
MAVNKIEQVLESVMDNVKRSKELLIPFSRRSLKRPSTDQRRRGDADRQLRKFVSFPGKTATESKLFTQVLTILQLSHQALLSGNFVTKRNIYYQYPNLFREQRIVDGLVDDIAYTFGIGRDSLNIVAASVGVVCGLLSFTTKDNVHCSASSQENGIAIPPMRDVRHLDLSACQWILVIEKELKATFRTLAASGYWNTSLAGPGVLVASKGYPTLVTRWFLHQIHETAPRLPIYGLVDYDPHGIRIFRTYKYGSQSLDHELNTTVAGMKWLGIRSGDLSPAVTSYGVPPARSALDDILPLTVADRRTAVCLLREMFHTGGGEQEEANLLQCREVQVMLMLNVKAEIQAADDCGDLTTWLDNKLCLAHESGTELV